ncbi:hypothetical protein KJ781_00770 [Patescibacteria group bacterium]|nr:hypothetical protein [Patescibacteria group bacterium]MBU1449014.1 hypothetical protein [Patescibacteria group bacterium]MBU2612845.1 hypothetical protein [Patescibacteria group bacterium]
MAWIKKLNELDKRDVMSAGGKGSALGELLQAGVPVPDGFVILTNAFDAFLDENGLRDRITAKNIRHLIIKADLPKDIAAEIEKHFTRLDSRFVAVRSSAVSEDSARASWAGQFDTFLNTSTHELLPNVKRCWASLFTPRAMSYRRDKIKQGQDFSMAVVVQKMLASRVAGVGFSIHPVAQDHKQMLIEAGYGLGESVVAGQITPDGYVVNKNDWQIKERSVNRQDKLLIRSPSGGDEWRKVDTKAAGAQKLPDSDITRLAKLIVRIEKHFGFPIDVEWAKDDNGLYVLQCRPITTLRKGRATEPTLLDYLKSQLWFFGIRADESLLFYSAKRHGQDIYLNRKHGAMATETLLIPLIENLPIRVFNLAQAKRFHAVSNRKILRNPRLLTDYIVKDDHTWRKIEQVCRRLMQATAKGNHTDGVALFKKSMDLYELASAYFTIIFSLGLKLAENANQLKNIGAITKKHDVWRNSVAFKEERLGESWWRFFQSMLGHRKSTIEPLELMKYLTRNEVSAWLEGKTADKKLADTIATRKRNGFIYLDLRQAPSEIIDDAKTVSAIKRYFLWLQKTAEKNQGKEIRGAVAYGTNEIITGRVIIIADKKSLAIKRRLLKDKILVAIQTTPHFIPYLKEAKAIVTDEGGLTCHAAIVAREMKKPCVVGAKLATKLLKDGDRVEIDTRTGVVRKIKE